MSGHSKWSTIKRKKGANDQARGKVFSKLSKTISLAAKEGGENPDMNYRLRMAIDAAKNANMPKDTIDRAIKKASEVGNISEIVYEGFGPDGVQFLIEVATDNKNRTAAEIKNIFQKSGGAMGGPGSASFNFEHKGYILINNIENIDDISLDLIDAGALDIQNTDSGIEIMTEPTQLHNVIKVLENIDGIKVIESSLIQDPITSQDITESGLSKQIINLMEAFEEHDDVQNVYTNANIV